MSTVRQKTRDVGSEARRVVGEQPLPAALTAFGVGVAVGVLGVILLHDRSRQQESAMAQRMLNAVSNAFPDALAKRLS